MENEIVEILREVNSISPLGLTAMLSLIIFILVKRQPSKQDLETVKENHLHELPAMAETLRRIESSMIRSEAMMAANFAHIRAKLEKRR